jgi:hypothetical protein
MQQLRKDDAAIANARSAKWRTQFSSSTLWDTHRFLPERPDSCMMRLSEVTWMWGMRVLQELSPATISAIHGGHM